MAILVFLQSLGPYISGKPSMFGASLVKRSINSLYLATKCNTLLECFDLYYWKWGF